LVWEEVFVRLLRRVSYFLKPLNSGMKKLTTLLLFAFIAATCFAQKASIQGTVTDTLSKQNLEHAVVSLLRSKDSVLYKFSRSKANGAFDIKDIQAGTYLLLVSYPTYADYYDVVSLQENTAIDLGKVMVTTKAHLLSDVTVVQKIAAVRMKGDTIVYKADSFHVKDGASVEDLLKKFPGIQVDKNGNITAMGTKVEKVMVDGEEFFGDDPTIATKNLNAKMVNEVQVFDKKSDQATFTGIDDGQVTRTINLKLKDDAKKGWFGKVEVGAGPKDVWNNSLMANSFKNKRKFSVYGIASSTGKTGLNWDEQGKFGGESGGGMQMTDDGGMYFNNGGSDALDGSNYWGEGIPKSWSGGLNYANKYNNDKQNLNGSYRYVKLINNGGGSTISQSILPDRVFFNNETRSVYGNKDRHSMNGSYDWLVDSFLSVKLTIAGTKGTVNAMSEKIGESLNGLQQKINQSRSRTSTNGDNQSFKSSLLIRKRFKKIGRTLSLSIDQSYNETDTEGMLFTAVNYYDNLQVNYRNDTTDQKKINASNVNTINGRLSYTEQVAKNTTLELTYGLNINKYQNKVLTYDKSQPEKYDLLNTKYSNSYDFSVNTNRVGSTLRFAPKKVNISIGGDIAFADFSQKDLLKDSTTKYSYTNLFPRANFVYKFNANKRITLNYNGSTRQPSIQQIQPVEDNTNPLFLQVGNANLKQEFNHRLNLNMNNYQVLKNRGYWLGVNYNFTDNAIRNNLQTNTEGKTISQYINADGNYNYGGNIGYNAKINKIDLQVNVNYGYNRNNNISFVNGLKNTTKTNRHNINLNFGKEKEKLYNFWFWGGPAFNESTSSINTTTNTKYWTADFGFDFTFQLPWKMEINNNVEAEIRQKTELFSGNNSVYVWNAYLAKKFLKNDKGQIRLQAYDIFDQNRGYSRNINSTIISENRYQQLSQYFLLSFIWNFSKGGATLNK
jgi:hypothetical protein